MKWNTFQLAVIGWALLLIFWANFSALALDCKKCVAFNHEIVIQKKFYQSISDKIKEERSLLKLNSAEYSSQKMKITAKLFVLVAQSETALNKIRVAEKNKVQMQCSQCLNNIKTSKEPR